MQSKIDTITDTFLAALSCVVGNQKAIYISTPITNGPAVLEAVINHPEYLQLSKEEFWEFLQQQIIPSNTKRARLFAKKIRMIRKEVVIDPSCFLNKYLSQIEYLQLWESVITQYTDAVWFNEGWSYSYGCVTEYCVAIKNRIPTFDHEDNLLLIEQAVELISKAIFEMNNAGLDTLSLEQKKKHLAEFKETDNK